MEPIDLLLTARWLIPIEPENLVLERHAVAVRQGRIAAILPTAEALVRYRPTRTIDRPHHVVMPGLVNAHTHAGMTLLRGAAESLPFDAWLRDRIWPLEKKLIDPEFVRDGVQLAIAAMVASGATCFAEQYFCPDVIAQTASEARMRACVGAPIIDLDLPWVGSAQDCLDKAVQLHDAYRDDPLISTALAPHSTHALGETTLARLRTLADEIDLPIAMHLHESAAEVAAPERPLALLERLGLLTPSFSGVHMTQLIESDFERIVRGGMSVAHCPQSNLKLGNGVAPIAELLERGVNVALGTDGAASNNDLDMLDELRTAALLAGPKVSAHRWLRIATLNGAKTLNLADDIGTLTPGKWADLCCIDLLDAHTQPVRDPATAIVYSASRSQVTDTFVAGRALWLNRAYTHLNLDDALRRAQAWQDRLQRS